MYKKRSMLGAGFIAASMVSSIGMNALASSHREAPAIAEDPAVDNTDLWAFTSPDAPNTVTIIAGYYGLEQPAGGPNFPRFSDNALYSIHIDNTGDAVPDITYQFRFTTTFNPLFTHGAVGDPTSFMSAGGSVFYNVGQIDGLPTPTAFHSAAVVQTMNITRVDATGPHMVGMAVPTAPTYTGRWSYGTGGVAATTDAPYAAIAQQAVQTLTSGERVFAGPRDDPFFVDLGDVFDDVGIRSGLGDHGAGIDAVAGLNVHIIAIQIPIAMIAPACTGMTFPGGPPCVVGIYAAASRPRVMVNRQHSRDAHGQFVQVSRLGVPLINELLIPMDQKDYWNTTSPAEDVSLFGSFLAMPSAPNYVSVLYGAAGIRAHLGYAPPPATIRSGTDFTHNDIVILASGALTPGAGSAMTPADVLRLNVLTPPTTLPAGVGRPTLTAPTSQFGEIAGDTGGFPNGRRLFDDVVDIEERYVLNGFDPAAAGVRVNSIPFGDGVDGNDVAYQATFPFAPIAHPGSELVALRTEGAH